MQSPIQNPPPQKIKIIDSWWTFLVATAFMGPFALPLLWRNPRAKTSTKIWGSVAVLIFTFFLIKFAANVFKDVLGEYEELSHGLN